MPRVRSRKSPLANPTQAIHALAGRMQDYLYLPDPSPLYITLGALVGNMLTGHPCWLLLVGPSGCGKSAQLENLHAVPQVHTISVIKGPATLISGVSTKERSKNATGGILPAIGARGCIVMSDFTSMLTLPRDVLKETLGALRDVHDGKWDRALGTEGGRFVRWSGQIGFIAGCTPAIDRHSSMISEMGERWIFYRFGGTDGFGEGKRNLQGVDRRVNKKERQELVMTFLESMGLDEWDKQARELKSAETTRLVTMSQLGVRLRSPVIRNPYNPTEVEEVAAPEVPTRMAGQLGQLYLGLEAIGLDSTELWRLVGQVALDSAPAKRGLLLRRAYELAKSGKPPMTNMDAAELLGVGKRTAMIALDDMAIHGVLAVVKPPKFKGGFVRFVLSDWAKGEMDQFV